MDSLKEKFLGKRSIGKFFLDSAEDVLKWENSEIGEECIIGFVEGWTPLFF